MSRYEKELSNLKLPALFVEDSEVSFQEYWLSRRKEILALLQEDFLGRWPDKSITTYSDKLISESPVDCYKKYEVLASLEGNDSTAEFKFNIYEPFGVLGKVPSFVFLNFDNYIDSLILKTILENGFSVAIVNYQEIEADIESYEGSNVQRMLDFSDEKYWGKIGTWAFGASAIVNYLYKNDKYNSDKIAVIGHSRLGLASAWCGAMDERVVLTICNNNGALYRGSKAEKFTDLAREYTKHWFSRNAFFNGRNENTIPFDMHFLHALIAPRYLYLAGASDDKWCDPHSQILSGIAASKIFELYSNREDNAGFIDQAIHKKEITSYPYGSIGYHLRKGEHDLTLDDWNEFIAFRKLHNI